MVRGGNTRSKAEFADQTKKNVLMEGMLWMCHVRGYMGLGRKAVWYDT